MTKFTRAAPGRAKPICVEPCAGFGNAGPKQSGGGGGGGTSNQWARLSGNEEPCAPPPP